MDQPTSNCLRRSYSVQYLKSFAQSCRESPPDIDLQEVNTELANELVYGEWRKTSSSPDSVKHTRRRRNRTKKHASPRDSEKGTTTVTLSELKAGVFSTRKELEPKTTEKAYATETTVSKVEVCNRSKIDKSRLSLTPLKLSDTDNEESKLACKDEIDASSSDEFQPEQKLVRHPKQAPAMQTTDTGDSSPGSTSSTSSTSEQKIDLDSLFKEKHRALPMPAARTVQDIEKEILLDKDSTSEAEAKTSPSAARTEWSDNEDKAASDHILSVLQQKNKGKFKSGGGDSKSEKELLGELISSSPISNELSNLDNVLKRYEQIAAADFQQAVSESKSGVEQPVSNSTWTAGLGCSSTAVDSVRTSVNAGQKPGGSTTKKFHQPYPLQQQQQQQTWRGNLCGYNWAPNVFVRSGVAGVGAPLVPQALHALQRLVDHQLHILNSIPGEVTPGMLHERLSRSVLGYPPTGTHLLFTTHLR